MKKLLIFVLVISLTLLTACSSSSNYAASSAANRPAASQAAAEDYSPSYASEARISAPASEMTQETRETGMTDLPLLDPNNSEGIMLSYSVAVELQTTEFMKGIRTLNGFVADAGGYLEECYVRGRDFYDERTARHATYTYQVPSAELGRFLMALEDNYNLLSLKQSSNNVTAEYQHDDTRLTQLQEQEARLLESLEATEDSEGRAKLEYDLRAVQRQISQLTASTGALRQSVVYSMVNVYLSESIPPREPEPPAPAPSWWEQLKATSSNSFNGMLSFLQVMVLIFASILPTLLLIGVIVTAIVFIRKAIKKKNRLKAANESIAANESNNEE